MTPRRHGPGDRRLRRGDLRGRSRRLRHAGDARGARLSAGELHFAAHQHAHATNMAARSRTACASRSKCFAPCARPGRRRSRCRCASRRPTGWTAASPATTRSRSRAPSQRPVAISSTSRPGRRCPTRSRSSAACSRRRSPIRSATRPRLATMCVGAITTADQVNTIIAAGRADLVALARPHLVDPYFSMKAAAWYGASAIHCPPQYLAGKEQLFRNSGATARSCESCASRPNRRPTATLGRRRRSRGLLKSPGSVPWCVYEAACAAAPVTTAA